MDTLKGQDNDILKKFSPESRCEIVIVPSDKQISAVRSNL